MCGLCLCEQVDQRLVMCVCDQVVMCGFCVCKHVGQRLL